MIFLIVTVFFENYSHKSERKNKCLDMRVVFLRPFLVFSHKKTFTYPML